MIILFLNKVLRTPWDKKYTLISALGNQLRGLFIVFLISSPPLSNS